ncbi:conserved hypothetical protein, secreted [Candidatus Magnetomorum sp. HK-1]|nr:conserved hypothetical protein, secreted [Candidatus Magnetomorum sp. HK-1]
MFYAPKKNYFKQMILFNFMLVTYSLVFIMIPVMALAGKTVTQTIHLNTGWNAIFLEVFPEEPNPDILFKDTPITQVLTI